VACTSVGRLTPCDNPPPRFSPTTPADSRLLRLPAPLDNALMDKSFQFSMRRTFVAVALFCVAVGLLLKADRYYNDVVMEDGRGEGLFALMQAAGCVAIGAAIGVILRRPWVCIAIAIACYGLFLMPPAVQ
jgi:hypothetical protein